MAYTKDQARAQVEALVANFRTNEASLADVPEAQIEDNYIRKLFRYLNWNTDNTGLSVAEWEFVLQRTKPKMLCGSSTNPVLPWSSTLNRDPQ